MIKVNTVGKILSKVKRAYLAGLMDGDGAIMACIERHKEKRFRFRVRVSVKITLSSENDIKRIKKLVGIGRIRKNRRTFEWLVRDRKDTEWFLNMIEPYTLSKIPQTRIALKILRKRFNERNSKSLYQKARLADKVAFYNIRSKVRRRNYASLIKESISRND